MFSVLSRALGWGMSKVWLAVGAVAAAVAIYWRGGTAAKQAERERQEAKRLREVHAEIEQHLKNTKEVQEKRDEVDRLSDDAVADRLRDKWTRDQNR